MGSASDFPALGSSPTLFDQNVPVPVAAAPSIRKKPSCSDLWTPRFQFEPPSRSLALAWRLMSSKHSKKRDCEVNEKNLKTENLGNAKKHFIDSCSSAFSAVRKHCILRHVVFLPDPFVLCHLEETLAGKPQALEPLWLSSRRFWFLISIF